MSGIYSTVMNKSKIIAKRSWLKHQQVRSLMKKHEYIIPETYRGAFYLANARWEYNTNWFIHYALGVIYTELVENLKARGYSISAAKNQVSSVMSFLEPCNNFIDLQFPLKRKNGDYEVVRGFRAEHGVHITKKPCLGGLRLCKNLMKSDVRALASLSTYKYACMGIDMLGAHGGILISPKQLTQDELQRIIEGYVVGLTKKGFCGESVDVFEPDVKCGCNEIMWIAAANSKTRGDFGNNCVVGKPVQFGGLKNREKAVAQGIVFGLDSFFQNGVIMKSLDMPTGWQDRTFILQGLGNVGGYVAKYLDFMGVKCIGIIDNDCHIYDPSGLSVEDAVMYKSLYGSLEGFNDRTKCTAPHTVLSKACDILVLAAVQNSIPYYIADRVEAKIIVEAANGPLVPLVHKLFVDRNKLVLPDIYINSGASIASYFEYLKNLHSLPTKVTYGFNKEYLTMLKLVEPKSSTHNLLSLSHDRNVLRDRIKFDSYEKCVVTKIVDKRMEDAAKALISTAEEYNLGLDFRTAAYIIALKKLFWAAYCTLRTSPV